MTQVMMTLTEGQGSVKVIGHGKKNFQKWFKKNKQYALSRIADSISPTDFILGTKVQPKKTQMTMALTFSRSLF